MTGIEIIAAERVRQVEHESFTSEHDDEHTRGQLASAAAIYATPADRRLYLGQNRGREAGDDAPLGWPWSWDWWKPSPGHELTDGRIRELAKAGALIAAEIDRLQRDEASDD